MFRALGMLVAVIYVSFSHFSKVSDAEQFAGVAELGSVSLPVLQILACGLPGDHRWQAGAAELGLQSAGAAGPGLQSAVCFTLSAFQCVR